MNEFSPDYIFQRTLRDQVLVPFYGRKFKQFELLDNDATAQKAGFDTRATLEDGRIKTIEEKIVRWKGRVYECFALETHSCTVPGHESPGWMVYSLADLLLYCFELPDKLDCYWVNMQQLKEWFRNVEKLYPPFQMADKNKTRGRVVPIEDVRASVPCNRFHLEKPCS